MTGSRAARGAQSGEDVAARIVAVIRMLGPGEVVTYGDVATDAGFPRQARLVGRILSTSSADLDLPWWRVVTAQGRLVPGAEREHAALLRGEGVRVDGHRVTWAPAGRFRATARGSA